MNRNSNSLDVLNILHVSTPLRVTAALVLSADGENMDETKNPWTVLSRAMMYENEWIRVDHHEVLGPSGGPGVYGTVHFKSQATGVVPIDENGNVILVGQYRFPLRAYSWEIPEGGGAHSVPALESAQRELREECGLAAKCWTEILGMDLSNSVSDERGTAFLAWELSEGPTQRDETEKLQVARVPFWDAVDRVKRGEIRDAISVAALVRVALMALQGELPEQIAKAIGRQGEN
jgi:8-oxo-dGTP pyrophosphatase MutT (NUDIX family)